MEDLFEHATFSCRDIPEHRRSFEHELRGDISFGSYQDEDTGIKYSGRTILKKAEYPRVPEDFLPDQKEKYFRFRFDIWTISNHFYQDIPVVHAKLHFAMSTDFTPRYGSECVVKLRRDVDDPVFRKKADAYIRGTLISSIWWFYDIVLDRIQR